MKFGGKRESRLDLVRKDTFVGFAFISPSVLVIILFIIVPAAMSVHYCLTDWNGVASTYNYVGLQNFKNVINAAEFPRIVSNTLFLVVLYVPVLNIVSILFAVTLFDIGKLSSFYKVVMYLPNILSSVVAGVIWRMIYNPVIGPLAQMLKAFGLSHLMQDLIGQSSTVMYALSVGILWYATGFYTLIYMGGLSGIPIDIYEAADIDGINSFQKLIYITIPMLMPSITINMVLATIAVITGFELQLVLTEGGPGYSSLTMALKAYFLAFREQRLGMSMALSVMITIISVTVSLIMLNTLRKREVEN